MQSQLHIIISITRSRVALLAHLAPSTIDKTITPYQRKVKVNHAAEGTVTSALYRGVRNEITRLSCHPNSHVVVVA